MVKRVVLGLLATLLFPHPADACSCAPLSPCHTFWMADTGSSSDARRASSRRLAETRSLVLSSRNGCAARVSRVN